MAPRDIAARAVSAEAHHDRLSNLVSDMGGRATAPRAVSQLSPSRSPPRSSSRPGAPHRGRGRDPRAGASNPDLVGEIPRVSNWPPYAFSVGRRGAGLFGDRSWLGSARLGSPNRASGHVAGCLGRMGTRAGHRVRRVPSLGRRAIALSLPADLALGSDGRAHRRRPMCAGRAWETSTKPSIYRAMRACRVPTRRG